MKIGIIIFNLTVILFLIFLIYFYVYINYKYETFNQSVAVSATTVIDSTINQNYLNNVGSFSEAQLTEKIIAGFDGGSQLFAYPASIIPNIKINFQAIKSIFKGNASVYATEFDDGYYWINFGAAGGRYIYCIMNEAYFGGGWMLAMRAVRNSTTFKYDSTYWTDTRTLNDEWGTINTILKRPEVLNIQGELSHSDIRKQEILKYTSSIGEAIFRKDLDPNIFDLKTDAFNSYNAREWMVIFYYKDDSGSIARGGDVITAKYKGRIRGPNSDFITTANNNTRGYIWYETPVSSDPRNEAQPIRQLFYDKTARPGGPNSNNNNVDFRPRSGVINAKELDKWKNVNPNTPRLWSCQQGYNFYGINWEIPVSNNFKVRWGFIWNNESHETSSSDVSCGIGMNDMSCRDYSWEQAEFKGCNSSIAFEFYVR